MSTALTIPSYQNFLAQPRNTGSSDYSKHLSDIYKSAITYLTEPVSRKKIDEANSELWDVISECSVANWDGYGAQPVSFLAVNEAFSFLNLLPAGLPLPEVMAEPNGEIGLEWDFGPNKVFAVSIKGNYSLAYAGILGAGSRTKGLESYSEAIPSVIIEGIKRIAR